MFRIVERLDLPVPYTRRKWRQSLWGDNDHRIYISDYCTERVLKIEDVAGNHTYLSVCPLGFSSYQRIKPTAVSRRISDFGGQSHVELFYSFDIAGTRGFYYTGGNDVYDGLPEDHPDFEKYIEVE
jgi:hypothetical protein